MNPRKYNWDDLFAGGGFKLLQGIDYDCSQIAMAQQIRNAAVQANAELPAERKFKVKIVDGGNWLSVKVERREHAEAQV